MDSRSDRPVLLVLRALTLGDLLLSVPALRGLRSSFPEHHFVLAAPGRLAPLIPLIGGINAHLAAPGLEDPLPFHGPVSVAVNLHGNEPESRLRLEELAPAHRIGHRAEGWPGPIWDEALKERERWAALLHWHGLATDPDDYRLLLPETSPPVEGATLVNVGAAPGGGQWPLGRYAAVARELNRRGHRVIVTGGTADRGNALDVASEAGLGHGAAVAGQWGLAESAAATAWARVVITADTSAGLLAAAFRTPSVVISSSAAPDRWGAPEDERHIVLRDPGLRRWDPFAAAPDPSMLAVWPGHVLDAVARLASG